MPFAARVESVPFDDLAVRFPEAAAAVNYDGYASLEEMYEDSDVDFFTVNGQLRSSSHDERVAMKYTDAGGWTEIPWEARRVPAA